MTNVNDDLVWVLIDQSGEEQSSTETSRSGGITQNPYSTQRVSKGGLKGAFLQRVPVKASQLEQGIAGFLKVMGRVLINAQQSAGDLAGMELDEIELCVEVNGEGQLSLLGSGGKAGGKGAMTLKFKKTA